jgi:isocitrate lyase
MNAHQPPDAQRLEDNWKTLPRWRAIRRDYSGEDVVRLRGSVPIESTLARRGAERLWQLLDEELYVAALGALTGNQALQMVEAGLKAIYLSGWQVAADANLAGQMYPDQSLYPCNSVPAVVRAINNTFRRADQIRHAEGGRGPDYFSPIVADAEAGFGGALNAFELMKAMIDAGAAGVHFEDQLASEKKCGHLGGKVLVPPSQFIRTLQAARLAADIMDVPTVLIARTDAMSAHLLTSDVDERDRAFLLEGRTPEGYFRIQGGLSVAIARALAYATYADILWCETSDPNLEEAEQFAAAVHERFPDKLLAYNCSPSFNWQAKLDDQAIAGFQRALADMGYRFQFITLAGFHTLNLSAFELASEYRDRGMTAYVRVQQREFSREADGYHATKHQRFVGTGYFDLVAQCLGGGCVSTTALADSTEEAQFSHAAESNGRVVNRRSNRRTPMAGPRGNQAKPAPARNSPSRWTHSADGRAASGSSAQAPHRPRP